MMTVGVGITRLQSVLGVGVLGLFLPGLMSLGGLSLDSAVAAQTLLPPERTETAALPRIPDLNAVGLPRILSATDARLYREIFDLQVAGKWNQADDLIARLSDRRLMGHVLFQRYMHPTAYRSRFKELKGWMGSYADHPGADRIYKLAMRRRPGGESAPRKPQRLNRRMPGVQAPANYSYRSPRKRSAAERLEVLRVQSQVHRNVLRTRLSVTEKYLTERRITKLLDQVELDQGYTQIAAAWLYYGRADKAYGLAGRAAHRSGDSSPFSHWIAGLSAWRLNETEDALSHFIALAETERSDRWTRSAGAYWASRAALRLRQPELVSRWLHIAAQYPYTFYGLLARQTLGMKLPLAEKGSEDTSIFAVLGRDPRAARAAALLQVGQRDLARDELLALRPWVDPEMTRVAMRIAERGGLPDIAYRLASRVWSGEGDGSYEVASGLYPVPPWAPVKGFDLDRALLYAFMRQESAFNPRAKSGSGARGLLQLMPATASFISGDRSLRRSSGRDKLFDPSLNVTLGQDYLNHLLADPAVGNNLFRLTVAYNGGPGNLRKWERHQQENGVEVTDPLLFIETLPSRETRIFIERVLTNFWIYRQRLGQDTPSLQALAAGDWPLYTSQDNTEKQ